jgi:hypothetical protein
MKNTSPKNRTIMSIIAIIIGLLMAYLVPFLVQTSLERVLVDLTAHIEKGNPAFTSGLTLFDLFYPIWRAVIFIAGVALILISQEIRTGTPWSFPLALALFALPSIGGMFMFLPYISWVGGFPLPMTISWIGLVGYWSFILLRKEELVSKLIRLATLTLLGMSTTHAFTIGVGAQRTMMTRPGHPLYPGFTWWLFNWCGEVNWGVVPLLFAAIPLLSVGKRRGWWFALAGAVTILMINIPTQIFRTKTLDYLWGSLLALGILILILVPYSKERLLQRPGEDPEEAATPASA